MCCTNCKLVVFTRNLGLWNVNSFMLGYVGETLFSLWAISKLRLPVSWNWESKANGRNIVGCYMLRPFAHPVGCCCAKFETGSNIVALRFGDHRTKAMLEVVGWKVWPVSNFTQQHPTTCNRVCKRTQHLASNNVGSCWPQCCFRLHWALD